MTTTTTTAMAMATKFYDGTHSEPEGEPTSVLFHRMRDNYLMHGTIRIIENAMIVEVTKKMLYIGYYCDISFS